MTATAPRPASRLPTPRSAPRRLLRAGLGLGLVATVLALPALLAGARLDAPPRPGELQRLAAAAAGGPGGSEVARRFQLATAPGVVPEALQGPQPVAGAAATAFVARARLVQVLFLFAASAGVYLATVLARGRLQALLACLCLPMLPPIAAEGHVLRPETAAVVFTLLALVLLQVLAADVHRRRRRGWRRGSVLVADGAVAALALGLAAAALPARGGGLLLPGFVMSVAALHLGARAVRLLRRNGLLRLPIGAINRRLWPWTLAAVLAPVAGLVLLQRLLGGPAGSLPATPSEVGLLPAVLALRWPLQALLGLGTVVAVLRIGLRFGRRGRIGPDLVLLLYCALQLACTVGAGPGTDALPAAPALAIVLSEGLIVTVGAVAWWWLRRRGAVTSARG